MSVSHGASGMSFHGDEGQVWTQHRTSPRQGPRVLAQREGAEVGGDGSPPAPHPPSTGSHLGSCWLPTWLSPAHPHRT